MTGSKDLDHTVGYLHPGQGGPPGQTRIGNLGPIGRYGHRVKTHAPGWRHHQPVPGVFLWRTPHGYWYQVDHAGTHPLGNDPTPGALAGRPAPEGLRIEIRPWHCPRPDPRSPAEAALARFARAG